MENTQTFDCLQSKQFGNYMMFWRLSRRMGTIDRHGFHVINGLKRNINMTNALGIPRLSFSIWMRSSDWGFLMAHTMF